MRGHAQVKTTDKLRAHRCTFLAVELFTPIASGGMKNPGEAADLPGNGRLDGVDVTHDTGTQLTMTPAEVLALLALPPVGGLTDQQIRGVTCVWDGIALAPGTAIDLGPRTLKRLDGTVQWFPRGCRRCTQAAVLRALHEHAPTCPECEADYRDCPVGHGLMMALRECR